MDEAAAAAACNVAAVKFVCKLFGAPVRTGIPAGKTRGMVVGLTR